MPRLSFRQILGNCVVFPEPVSPQTITAWFAAMAWISARLLAFGKAAEVRLWETLVARLGFVFGETNLLGEFLNCGQVAFVQKYSVEVTSVMQYPHDDDTVRR